MTTNPGRTALGSSGKFAPDPAPRLNGPAKVISPVASPVSVGQSTLPPPLTSEQVHSYKVDAKPGPVILMNPTIRSATAPGRSGSPVPSRAPPNPPSNPNPTSPPTAYANGKGVAAVVPAPTVAPTSPTPGAPKARPQSAMPMATPVTPKPEAKPVAQPPPPPPPVTAAQGKSVIVFKRPKNGAASPTSLTPSPSPPPTTPTPTSPPVNKMRISEVPLPQAPRTTYGDRPYSVAQGSDWDGEAERISPRRNIARSVDGAGQVAARDAVQQVYHQKIKEAKDTTDQELRAFVAEVATFQDFTRSTILQELNLAAHKFLGAQHKHLLHGGCRRFVQDIISFLRHTKEGGAVLSKVEERATSKLLLVIMKFSRILGAFEGEKDSGIDVEKSAPTPQPAPAAAPVVARPTPSPAPMRGMHAPIQAPHSSPSPPPSNLPPSNPPPPTPMEEIVICRICERKIASSDRAKHTDTCTFRTQADPRIAYCNESMTKCLTVVMNLFRTTIAQQASTQQPGQKLTLKICWISEQTGDITLTKMMSPDSTEPVLSVLHKILSSPGTQATTENSVVHFNEWGLYVPRVGVWLDERLSIGSYDLRDKENVYFKKRPRDNSNRPKSMAGSRLSTVNAASAVNSITNQEFIDTVKTLVVQAIAISMTKNPPERPDEEMLKHFRFFQQIRTQNVLYKTRCAKEDREILDRMKEKMEIITKLVELKKSSRRKSIYEAPTGRHSIADFEIVKPISRGAFGQVFLARKKATGDIFAIKAIKKSEAVGKNQASKNHLAIERNILTFANNTCVVKLYYTFQSKNYLYMVMEYLPGGDLFSLLRNMNVFEEEWARRYCAEIVLALDYLHGNNIIHRDLKPDNVLISRSGHIKLTDFGLSEMGLKDNIDSSMGAFMEPVEDEEKETAKGSPEYLAPEILLGNGSTFTADWWALGVMLYEFMVGITPFYADTIDDVFQNVLSGEVKWPEAPDQEISEEAMDLVHCLLNSNPAERLGANGAAEVKQHPFFAGIDWDALLQESGPMVPKMDDSFSTEYFEARNDLYKVDYVINIDEETRDEVKDQRMRRWTGVNFANLKELTLGQG